MRLAYTLLPLAFVPIANAQSSLSLSLTTGSITVAISTTVANHPTQATTVVPAVYNVTYTIVPTPTADPNATASATSTPEPIVLATRLDPAFGVLGALLILTGLPSAFWGHKNRWTSFFLIGFYTLSLVCFVLILKFGILPAINPPSGTLRGMFVLSCSIAGFAGGAIAIFFWKAARYGIGAWGGFALALWIQCFHNGGLIKPIGYRWILYIGCGVVGFSLCTIPKIHYHVLLLSTALVGATSFMLGVDCFTTAGLKEFYIWNLGFPSLFPKFTQNGIQFPVSQQMQIELGLTGAVALMGVAVQFRVLRVLQKKLHEIAEEEKKRDEEAEVQAADRFGQIQREQDEWEKEHPTLPKHGRQESSSSAPLIKDRDRSCTPTTVDHLSSQEEGRARVLSGISADFKVAPTSEEDLRRASRYLQNPGVLPTLDLGTGIQEDVPASFIANEKAKSLAQLEDIRKKEELLAEIQNIRRSIDVLKSETPIPSSSGDPSRRPSLASRRTLSIDANHALVPLLHARPPRATDPRARSQSMELSALARPDPINRPTSVPLGDAEATEWDTYIQERKLLQPPAGVTAPIPTTAVPSSSTAARAPLPPAVQEALNMRKKRESMMFTDSAGSSAEDVPLSRIARPHGGGGPVTILPPRRAPASQIAAPVPQPSPATRTRTFEELNERHREKMRDIQAPLTRAEKEHVEIEAARQRWERSKAIEKEAMAKRQAEKAAALQKKRRESDTDGRRRSQTMPLAADVRRRHSKSMSGDRMGMGGGLHPGHHESSSRRLSTMKVEDWQRYQQDVEETSAEVGRSPNRTMPLQQGVPFPADARRKNRDYPS